MFFRKRKNAPNIKPANVVYTTPVGRVYDLYTDMLKQHHLMIAGSKGSGKSVLLNQIIHTALYNSPVSCQFIFIDLKGVELIEYADLPHTLGYAYTIEQALYSLEWAKNVMANRFNTMRAQRVKKYQGADIYIIIDEFAELMTRCKREVTPLIQSLCQMGRAAKIHVILCTQCPLRDIIPTSIKCNFDSRVALRTATKQDSRNIIDVAGCELLPVPEDVNRSECYYKHSSVIEHYNIPTYPEGEHKRIFDHWSYYKALA